MITCDHPVRGASLRVEGWFPIPPCEVADRYGIRVNDLETLLAFLRPPFTLYSHDLL
jgi:hypothetical protein